VFLISEDIMKTGVLLLITAFLTNPAIAQNNNKQSQSAASIPSHVRLVHSDVLARISYISGYGSPRENREMPREARGTNVERRRDFEIPATLYLFGVPANDSDSGVR
jgi:hypothetical protein